ncbi:hypothetical protein [Streptoalloteichus hindustanus]|uniref:Uncharacterized protein n=1 Tax=Streptoalloteichus hindustanus TaxID=2017 RepID=A0A1M4TVY6_STRHI|nr:hypothetical protein [Streptoalloteichus hindustanus]SHE48641.1 hypothetical protein SAMN05444320_101217 [Streptoalloteichus hindustanus]
MPPVVHPTVPEPPPAPRPVVLARWLWIASALLGAVRSVIKLADRNRMVDELRRMDPKLGQDQLDQAASGGVTFGLLLALALLGLYVLLANRMAGGWNPARIVLAVLGGLGVFGGLVGLAGISAGLAGALGVRVGALDVVVAVISLLLDAVALVLMFLPQANGWFAHVGYYRRTQALARPTR